jgi:hypothetical protein
MVNFWALEYFYGASMSNFHGRTHLVLVERTSEGLIRSFEILNYTLGDQKWPNHGFI